MKRNLIVILLISGRRSKGRKQLFPCLWPILGQSSLSFMAEKVERFKPQIKIIAGENIEQQLESPAGWELISLKVEGKENLLLDWINNLFPQEDQSDFLVINPSFPLVKERSLHQLLKQHLLKKAGLTYFIPLPQASDLDNRTKKEALFSNFVAFVFQRKALSFSVKSDSNFSVADCKEFLALKTWLERAGEKTLGVPLTEIESLNVQNHESKLKIISFLRQKKIEELSKKGVTFVDPESVWIDLRVKIGSGSVISPAVVIEGDSSLGQEVKVHPFVHIIDSQIGPRTTILSSCVIEGSQLGLDVRVGPFTHLRPGTVIKAGARVGNFVEMKKTIFGRRSKAMHLSYLGDSIIEDEVNIGAGTITCNYDGRQKHQTIIEKGAFIGSGTELVAPVKIGRGAYVGAGSTITKNVSPDALAIARARQVEIPEWAKRRRQK